MKEFLKRVITAIFLLSLLYIVWWFNSFAVTWSLLGIITLLATIEAVKLLHIDEDLKYILPSTMFIWGLSYFYINSIELIFIFIAFIASKLAYAQKGNIKLLFIYLYPIAPMLFILELYKNFGMDSLVWLLVVVASTDVGAYIIGRMFGKNSFSITSPNKTLEGVAGGIVIGTILGGLITTEYFEYSYTLAFVISFFTSFASIFGDLFESYLKRSANVKDSGNILPGHGGILDRIDGYLFGVIAMFITLKISLL